MALHRRLTPAMTFIRFLLRKLLQVESDLISEGPLAILMPVPKIYVPHSLTIVGAFGESKAWPQQMEQTIGEEGLWGNVACMKGRER